MRADGMLVSGGYDASLLLWSASGRPERELSGHRALVNCVRFSPDGARVASASSDHTARIWSAAKSVRVPCAARRPPQTT